MDMSLTTTKIGVKQAVQVAKSYVLDAFAGDNIEHVGLEEIAFDDEHDQWLITIGFSRPWDKETVDRAAFESGAWSFRYQELLKLLQRTYKVVSVSRDGTVKRVENRPV